MRRGSLKKRLKGIFNIRNLILAMIPVFLGYGVVFMCGKVPGSTEKYETYYGSLEHSVERLADAFELYNHGEGVTP